MTSTIGALVAGSRRRALLVVVLWLLLAGVVPRLTPTVDEVKDPGGANSPVAGAESGAARDLLLKEFPDQRGVPAIIVLRSPGGLTPADEAEVARIGQALTGPDAPEGVDGVVSVATTPQAKASLVSPDGTTTTIIVPIRGLSSNDDRFLETVEAIRKIAAKHAGDREVLVTGPAGIATDAVKVFKDADLVLLLITVALVLGLLLIIYRSPLLALIPLLGVGVALQLTEAVGAALADAGVITIDASSASIMTVLLFGAGTDYALFLVMRFREELATTTDRYAAMRAAIRRVGGAVLSSGLTVVLALLTLLLAVVPATREFGSFLALGVAMILLVTVTFLPAAVLLAGKAAFWPMRQVARDPGELSFWGRVGAVVLRRPLAVAASGLVVLVALALGLVGYTPNSNLISDFRAETDSLRGQQVLDEAFPAGQLAPTTVLVRGDAAAQDVEAVAAAVRGVEGVASVGRPVPAPGGGVVRLQVVYDDDPYGTPALERTGTVREVASRAAPGAEVLVGGESANALDNRTLNARDFRIIAVAMAVLILTVLGLLLRAVAAPLVLLGTTALSLMSALGVTVLTWVTFAGQAGTSDRVPLYSLIFLVALGVDYNILLASRMREELAIHGFPEGIRVALTRTGGVITSAGLILAGTFAVLMTQPINSLLQFGFAMAVGLLLDTFLIRGALVPALFRLAGPRVWYPSRLGRDGGPSTTVEEGSGTDRTPVPAVGEPGRD
ncbi:MAG: MMPL family transporter [Actinomycetales bacterium]|nr:MMPL family transporter [Actinomycetales bacterium]